MKYNTYGSNRLLLSVCIFCFMTINAHCLTHSLTQFHLNLWCHCCCLGIGILFSSFFLSASIFIYFKYENNNTMTSGFCQKCWNVNDLSSMVEDYEYFCLKENRFSLSWHRFFFFSLWSFIDMQLCLTVRKIQTRNRFCFYGKCEKLSTEPLIGIHIPEQTKFMFYKKKPRFFWKFHSTSF